MSLFVDDLEKAVNEVKQADAVVSETEKLNYKLKALTENYSYTGDLVDVLPERERTVDYLKSKIKLKRTESVTQTSNDTSNVFKADTKPSFHCFGCGKPGHLRRDCKATGNVNRGRGFSYYRSHGTYNNSKENVLTLSQKSYIESLAKRYCIENSKLFKTPMEVNLKLQQYDVNENVKYRNLIGALLYISSGTRPDISYSVNYLSRFQNCYNETHFKYALRVLKYLYLTRDLKLTYCKNNNVDVLRLFC